MPVIKNISVASPEFSVIGSDMQEVAEKWLKDKPELKEKFLRISSNSGVEQRRFVLPYAEILEIGGLKRRAEIFNESGLLLSRQVLEASLRGYAEDISSISHLILTSCSVPVIPALDGTIIQEHGLANSVKRVPIFQHGCAGGVAGLSLANDLAVNGTSVLVMSLELCSLVFQFGDTSGSQLVGASIFADGAASALVSQGKGSFKIIDTLSFLIPGTKGLMGYDIFDDGLHLLLDRELPSALIKAVPEVLSQFLSTNNLKLSEISYYLFHPGGRKILDMFEEKLSIQPENCHWARDVLKDCGNMSSATIFYVIDRFLSEKKYKSGELALVLGIGPGLSLEMLLLECQDIEI